MVHEKKMHFDFSTFLRMINFIFSPLTCKRFSNHSWTRWKKRKE